ncbi:MAG: L-lactate permease [Candidatus Thorarchaeota archaeon]
MSFILALTPIILILFLMIGLRWGAPRAGGAGYLTALIIAITYFGAGAELLAYAHTKALLLTVDVLLIIWAAFLLYRVADEAGAIRTIVNALPHLTNDQGMLALIIGWVFASFLQGVGGFGVPVAVIAPILVGLGFTPLAAVLIPSIGHGWAVTFGSLGSSFQALMASTGLAGEYLAPAAAIFLGTSGLFVGGMVAHAATGWGGVRRLYIPIGVLGFSMAVGQYLVVMAGLWNIGAFGGSLIGLLVGYPLARRYRGEKNNNGQLNVRDLMVALSGYMLLILVILGVQLIPVIKEFLGQLVLQVNFPEIRTSLGHITPAGAGRKLVIFRHTGVVLFYTSVLAYLVYRRTGLYSTGAIRRILDGTLRRVLSSSVSIASMVTMAVIMEHAGMTDTLAEGLAGGMGGLFPVVAPWIGGLGAFMTGSNTNSNVVFGALQLRTAELLGYSAAIILAGQTAGAALASVMAPTKVVVGASTAGMSGREGEVMRKLALYTGILILIVSLLTIIGVWIVG